MPLFVLRSQGRSSRMDFLARRLRRFFNRNYRIAKAWRYPYYCWTHRRSQNPVIVYQMGKVGSSSVVAGLEASHFEVFQVHVLTHDWISKVEAQYEKASRDHNRGIIDEHLLASMFLRRWLDRGFDGKRARVVTLIRDPVARNMSSFFQGFPIYFSEIAAQFRKENLGYEAKVAKLIDLFLNEFQEHDTPLNWFDVHFKPAFEIDVFAQPFPHDQGFMRYQSDNCDAILLRLEDLRRVGNSALSVFLGGTAFELKDANVASEKTYADAYDQFKNDIRLPAAYLDRMYDSKFSRHFYTADEIARFRRRWEQT